MSGAFATISIAPVSIERLTLDHVAWVKVASQRPTIWQTAHHPVSHPIGSFRVWAADARRALIRATLRLPRRPVFWAVPASPPVWQHLVYRLDRTHPQCAASGSPPDLMPRIFLIGPSSGDPFLFWRCLHKVNWSVSLRSLVARYYWVGFVFASTDIQDITDLQCGPLARVLYHVEYA